MKSARNFVAALLTLSTLSLFSGCSAPYNGVVRPTPQLEALAPELKDFSDAKIEQFLKADAKTPFPTVLAVARLCGAHRWNRNYDYGTTSNEDSLDLLSADESAGWRKLADPKSSTGDSVISQVQFINPMLVSSKPSLKELRDAAAMVHARTLLVYRQEDSAEQGHNSAAMGYWTIVGLFCIPGHTVGHYCVCEGLLIDTRTGLILATIQGESKREENVLPGAVDIAAERTARQSQAESAQRLQEDAAKTLTRLALTAAADSRRAMK